LEKVNWLVEDRFSFAGIPPIPPIPPIIYAISNPMPGNILTLLWSPSGTVVMSLTRSKVSGQLRHVTKYLAVMLFISTTIAADCFLLATICPEILSYA
jgi:hypothetical protein